MNAESAPALADAQTGIVLICYEAENSAEAARGSLRNPAVSALCLSLVRALLERSQFDLILYLNLKEQRSSDRPAAAAAIRDAINRAKPLPPANLARLRVREGVPPETSFSNADILVSLGPSALIRGCRAGLKPVQIGQGCAGTEAFSHVFPDIGSFVDAVRNLQGQLSIEEYEGFEKFCQTVIDMSKTLRARNRLFAIRRGPSRDILARECCVP
jgi:hypothetical protein